MVVEPGDRVQIAFTATYPDGELFDTSSLSVAREYGETTAGRYEPMVLEVGAEPALDALQAGLLGMEEGGTKRVGVPNEQLRFVYDREDFESMVGAPPEIGTKVRTQTGLVGEIVELGEQVTVDFAADRNGETVTFEVEVLAVE